MNEMDDLLQERLEMLEMGEPLERCLDGAPDEVAQALQMAVMMREVAVPASAADTLTAERTALLSLAAAELPTNTSINTNQIDQQGIQTMMEKVQAWIQARSAFDWVVAAVLGPALVVTILILGGSLFGDDPEVLVELEPTAPSEVAAVAETPTAEPTVAQPTATSEPEATAEPAATEIAAVPEPTIPAHQLYLPLSSNIDFNPATALLGDVLGVVEVQNGGGDWERVINASQLAAGSRVRTADFSSATITFYDGSFTTLGPDSELSLDTVDVKRPEDGFRTLVMTQWRGESDHDVLFRNDGGSLYEVKTPDQGSGVARGTKFKVIFNPGQLSRYLVTEGRVDVRGNNRTVTVVAGQVTAFPIGLVPIDPVYSVSGEGEVTAVGSSWTVAGQTFQTDEYTVIVGNPQVGDLVRIDGRLLADGSRMADRIVLIRRAVVDEFSLSGEVEEMGGAWVVAGQTIVIGNQTVIDDDIDVGDEVQVNGVILADGILQALEVMKLDDAPGLPFSFGGVVQVIGDSWSVSGQTIVVNGETEIDDDIELNDVVSVSGWILEDGRWLATEIELNEDDLATFEFSGVVQGSGPWQVAGVTFEIRPWTSIDPQISLGDRVQVRGVILSDGTKVAESITLMADNEANVVTFVGVVSSVNPWVVNGVPLVVTGDTVIGGDIAVGLTVVVQAQLQPDGSWVIVSIRPLYPEFGLGCLYISSPITMLVNGNTIRVRHWEGDITVNGLGNVAVNHVVTLPLCTGWDGTIIVINTGIIVIYRPIVIIIDDGGGGAPPAVLPPGCKVTKKGKIKCTKKSTKKSTKKDS